MNSVMEELGTVLAYRSQELGTGDMEGGGSNGEAARESRESSQGGSSFPDRKKPRRIYSAKKEKPHMGPISDGRGAGGSGILALCLSSRRNMCIHERVMSKCVITGVVPAEDFVWCR